MLIDSRSVPLNTIIHTEICIVGGGTAGLILARELVGQKFQVTILESGGLMPDKETQNLGWGHMAGHRDHSLDTARPRFLGGSSNRWDIGIGNQCNGVRMRPLDELDFEKRDGIPYSGWPFSKAHLDTYYRRAQALFGMEPDTYNVDYWENACHSERLEFKNNRIKTVIFKFGSHRPVTGECVNQVITSENITTYLYANVVDIDVDKESKAVKQLQVACLNGNRFRVTAKILILANGAVEIPRLLLSSDKIYKSGLGNHHGLVGRFFMQHLHFYPSGLLVPFHQNLFQRSGLYNQIHMVRDVPVIGKLALSEDVIRKEQLLNYVAGMYPTVVLKNWLKEQQYAFTPGLRSLKNILTAVSHFHFPEQMRQQIMNVVTNNIEISRALYFKFKGKSLNISRERIRIFRLANMSEQVPNPDSRVTLAEDRDALGMKRVRLDWRLHEYDIWSAVRSQQILNEEIQKAGLGKLYIQLHDDTIQTIHGGWHHMGTTRMHNNPEEGVVDENCLVHGISNLYIAGPSVFPTGGYANPSLTIAAMTLRLADHLKMRMNKYGNIQTGICSA